jgi:diguanylate cyclase (GGDEF)-like protein/hemerythrin-like metal-binding protein
MESFSWNSNFETGLKDVDDQHRRLVDIINSFGESFTEGEIHADSTENIFKELAEYADYHFREEEELMTRTSIDKRHTDFQIQEHKNFLGEVQALHSGLRPEDSNALKQLLDFLINWLAYHILGADQKMARQIHAVQSGTSPEMAYENEEEDNGGQASEPLVSALSQLFNLLTTRNKQLLLLNQSLEDKVVERTRELTLSNRKFEELALTDVLTGLFNRRYALRALQTIWEEAESSGTAVSCLMIDADNFKEVNDNWGHDAGDDVLIELARTIGYSLRTDDILCRLGGDEFFVICPATDLIGGTQVAESVLGAVRSLTVPTGEGTWVGSISIGVAEKTADMNNYDEIVKSADTGVYKAKNAGRNCVRTIQAAP